MKQYNVICLWNYIIVLFYCIIIRVSHHGISVWYSFSYYWQLSQSVCNLALFNLFMSSVFNVVNTDDNIQPFAASCSWPPYWNVCLNNIVSILNRAYVKKTDDINRLNRARSHTDSVHVVYKIGLVVLRTRKTEVPWNELQVKICFGGELFYVMEMCSKGKSSRGLMSSLKA